MATEQMGRWPGATKVNDTADGCRCVDAGTLWAGLNGATPLALAMQRCTHGTARHARGAAAAG